MDRARPVSRQDLSFRSGSDECAAWLYRPEDVTGPVPCVVMAHGFSMTRHDGLETYAERFAAAGAAVLVFDFRHLGDSGGEPRQTFNAADQRDDLVAAVEHARGLDGVDPDRIVVWGYSFSGGTAVQLAAADPRIAGAILTDPFLDGRHRVIGTVRRSPLVAVRVMAAALRSLAGRPVLIPVTGASGSCAAMSWPGEAEGFAAAAAPGSPWRNEISPAVFATVAFHRPVRLASDLTCPVWVSLGERDITVSNRAIERLAERAAAAELHRYDVDHFEPCFGAGQQRIAADQADWLRRTLLG
ncbi:alpha/beta hydrolase [Aeromicrobium sp. A1-2]|uniref:alpha/beta hydrolase n=1 Tax=Aeromicrobium sp. A1-2 TaxID=2107713 RepID=UPI000E47AD95|nr:alpha/beta fold hydrolase [Aeromicrobium sp. A1-2]AXT86426.1 alpha/beta hydrolase [Aeromicrobium sp. A1-2]